MFCPKCGAAHDPNYPFCTECGAPLLPPKAKKGSLWPPLIFIAVMLAVGIGIFFAYPNDTALAQTPWFTSDNGSISFDASLYSGPEELTVPEGISGLAEGCFYDCDQLTTVHLPDSLTTVGERAFAQCDALRGIKLPEGVTVIGDRVFASCSVLEAVAIPAAVKTIGSDVFADCPALRHIFFDGTKNQWNTLYPERIGKDVTIYCVDGTISQGNANS